MRYRKADPDVPEPGPDARAHSDRVRARVRDRIDESGGWISFAEYMQIVLYAPGLGYYVSGARKFGSAGDFVTAPEITPLFAAALATQVAAILEAGAAREIVEFGAGTGRLAVDLLLALDEATAAPARYRIIEISPELRERQRATVSRDAPRFASRVEWLDRPPEAIEGAVLANEVLDAVPPHLVVHRRGEWLERGVALDPAGRLCFDDRPSIAPGLREIARSRFPSGVDLVGEVNPAAEAWVEDVGLRLRRGAMLVIDYGFPQRELYHPERSEGTLMGHYRHRAHGDPFLWPGLSDLTTHVDFTALAGAGLRAGLSVAGFATQAAFLLGCGLLERLAESGEPGSVDYIRSTAAVNTLVSPSEMGELFKVLALSRETGIRWPGFALGDMRHRL